MAYLRIFRINHTKTITVRYFLSLLLINFYVFSQGQTQGGGVTDIDGNTYETVIIGTQEWMAENLRTTRYSNGDTIPNDSLNWISLTTGAWVNYNNDSQYDLTFGKFYNWYTVSDPRNVCPTGWHVPSKTELDTLRSELGGGIVAGGKLKSIGTLQSGTGYWEAPNTNATNSTGFNGHPCGFVNGSVPTMHFANWGYAGMFWMSTESPTTGNAYMYILSSSSEQFVFSFSNHQTYGASVRCVQGEPLSVVELDPQKKELIRVIDLMGREVKPEPNRVLIYIYSDGTTKKVFLTE